MNRQLKLRRHALQLLVAWSALMLPRSLWAQAAPAPAAAPQVLPENPQSPTDFKAMPPAAPAAAAAPAGQVAAPAGRSAAPLTGYSGGDMVINEKVRRRGPVPQFHVVRQGDSLWRLCEHYYSDPWAWPQLWANNSSITNPHWIYPGDKVRMIGASAEAGTRSDGGGTAMLRGAGSGGGSGAITLRQDGYVDDEQLAASGVIAGSKHENQMLSLFQEIYLRGNKSFKPRAGELFTIYKVKRSLKSSDRKLGHIVEILGTARIKRLRKDKLVTAEIVASNNVIERGARVGPLRRTFRALPARPAKNNLAGRIVEFLSSSRFAAQSQLVFLDRGRKDGVLKGNRFLVMRRGDGYRPLYQDLEQDDPKYPREPVAEVTVLDVREHASVGLVTKATQEVRRGDFVRMRRGY